VVAVTGAAGPAGQAVVRALLRQAGDPSVAGRPRKVVAVDSAPEPAHAPEARAAADPAGPASAPAPDQPAAVWQQADLTSPEVADALTGVDVVIHLATPDDLGDYLRRPASERRRHRVRSAQAVTIAAAAVGARRLIAVTSAMVLGARPDNPVPLPEDCELRAEPDEGLIGDLLEVEAVLARTPAAHPGLALTVLRPAALVGPGVDTAVTRHFEAPRLLTLRGHETSWQFCHVDDLAAAVLTVLDTDLDGYLGVGAPGSLRSDDVERLSGMRRLDVPAGLAFSTAERLHRVGVLPTPAGELAFVVHPWAVDSARLEAEGWRARHDNEACLRELLVVIGGRHAVGGRRVERRDAAMGAAGAAVALLGTAAILRQARSRTKGRRRPTLDP
jgi:nucleoside-diphosphate-sugar epimerase